MHFYDYVIKSQLNGKLYTGHTSNLKRRLTEHNFGKTKSIKANIPNIIIYTESFSTRTEAVGREKYLTFGSGREFLLTKL